jgi:hypothetical protein
MSGILKALKTIRKKYQTTTEVARSILEEKTKNRAPILRSAWAAANHLARMDANNSASVTATKVKVGRAVSLVATRAKASLT